MPSWDMSPTAPAMTSTPILVCPSPACPARSCETISAASRPAGGSPSQCAVTGCSRQTAQTQRQAAAIAQRAVGSLQLAAGTCILADSGRDGSQRGRKRLHGQAALPGRLGCLRRGRASALHAHVSSLGAARATQSGSLQAAAACRPRPLPGHAARAQAPVPTHAGTGTAASRALEGRQPPQHGLGRLPGCAQHGPWPSLASHRPAAHACPPLSGSARTAHRGGCALPRPGHACLQGRPCGAGGCRPGLQGRRHAAWLGTGAGQVSDAHCLSRAAVLTCNVCCRGWCREQHGRPAAIAELPALP